MSIQWVSWVSSALFLLAVAYLFQRQLRLDDSLQNASAFIFLWITLTTFKMFLFGLAGFLSYRAIGTVSVFGMLILLLLPGTRRELIGAGGTVRRFSNRIYQLGSELPAWLRWFILALGFFSLLRFAFLIWALPPFVWDSLTYHLTNVAQWTQSGEIGLFATPIDRTASPANFEVFTTWFTVFLHHDVVVEAAGLPAYLLAGLAFLSIGREFRLRWEPTLFATLAFLSTPALLLATTGTKNDPMIVALFLLSISYLLAVVLREGQSGKHRLNRAVLLVLISLYAIGTKTYWLYLIPGLFLMSWLTALAGRRRGVWRRLVLDGWREVRTSGTQQRAMTLLLVLMALLLGSYWYGRNLIVFGNPFYPYGLQVGSAMVLEGSHSSFPLNWANLQANLTTLLHRFGDKEFVIIPALHLTTGWGWFAYVLGFPLLVWGFLRQSELRGITLGFILSALLILMSVPPDPWNMRYLAWIPAVLALAFACFYDRLLLTLRWERFVFLALGIACVVFNITLTLNYNRVSVDDFLSILSLPVSQRGSAHLHVYVDSEYEQALNRVPGDEVLGYSLGKNSFVYPLYRPDFSQVLVYIPVTDQTSCAELKGLMQSRETRWLFAMDERTLPGALRRIQACASEGILEALEGGLYVIPSG